LQSGAWKAVHVLAGSVIEAVLIDALDTEGVDTAKLHKLHLRDLIQSSKEKGILSDETSRLTLVVQDYRNLIHPGKLLRLEKLAERSGATIAAELIEIIVKEVAARKQATYGYTAEQLYSRLTSGPTALGVLSHLLKDSKGREIERLLVELLRPAYLNALQSQNETAQHLRDCYRRVFDSAPREVQARATKRMYKECFRAEDEPTMLACEKDLFRAHDLQFLENDERQFVKDHLLKRLDSQYQAELLYTLQGIGPFLEPEEARTYALVVASEMCGADSAKAAIARILFESEYDDMSPESRASTRLVILETPELFEKEMIEPIKEFVADLERRELFLKIRNVVQ